MFTTKGGACGGGEINMAEEESEVRHSIADTEISKVLKVDWFQ
jgi:hypothetical protein